MYEERGTFQKCDNEILGRLESYAYKILYSGKIKGLQLINEVTSDGVEWTRCEGVDYTKFKLFLISLLWRFSISTNEFYKFIKLTKDQEEELRKMILQNDAGKEEQYTCTISTYRRNLDLPIEIISQPLKHIHAGHTCYGLLISGFLYNFYVSTSSIPDYILEMAINKNGSMKVVHIPKNEAIKILRRYMALPNK